MMIRPMASHIIRLRPRISPMKKFRTQPKKAPRQYDAVVMPVMVELGWLNWSSQDGLVKIPP